MILPAARWLETARIPAQSLWFLTFALALGLTLSALRRGRPDWVAGAARIAWGAAMGTLILGWLSGATLEMMRRAALVSGLQLFIAIGAFSLLTAGTLSLAREWFGENWRAPLRSDKIALSLGILTLAGWWFGGLALERNALWFLSAAPESVLPRAPDVWALLLGGATLLGASRGVRPPLHSPLRASNPRLSTWWIFATVVFLDFGARNPVSAIVLIAAGSVFCAKIWRARHDCPRFLHAPLPVRIVGILSLTALPILWVANQRATGLQNGAAAWQEPHQIAAWALLVASVAWLFGPLRPTLRMVIFDRFFDRALLQGALAGAVVSTLLVGPGGAVFWMFWPLCGLFFDLLAPREPIRTSPIAAELPAAELAPFESAP